jgi:hypothetical protein
MASNRIHSTSIATKMATPISGITNSKIMLIRVVLSLSISIVAMRTKIQITLRSLLHDPLSISQATLTIRSTLHHKATTISNGHLNLAVKTLEITTTTLKISRIIAVI